jgi:hypothetical protein
VLFGTCTPTLALRDARADAWPRLSADVKFPQSLRISSLVAIKLTTLQELAAKHTLPAVTISAISNETLPKELRDKQTAMGGADNEALYTMFAQSMEHRSNVCTARSLCTLLRLLMLRVS